MLQLTDTIPFNTIDLLPKLISNYLATDSSLSFLTKYPFELSAFKDVISDKAKDNTDRKTLVEVLKKQYINIPTSSLVTANIELLIDTTTFTIVAAHQPCLFMGPLFNIYKIACTINTCLQLKAAYPTFNFVPVFWMGSEDHDVEELNNTFINGTKIVWNNTGTGAVGRWKTESMQPAIEELKTILNNEEITNLLEQLLTQHSTFGEFTHHYVNDLFKIFGLVVINQDDKQLKAQIKEVIKDELLNARAVSVLKETVDFLELNYKAQAKPRDINFFYLGEGYRERIILNTKTDRYEINNTSLSFSREEMLAEIENHTEKFSPNVIYRPLFQEIVLPNLAFIGGAGELSYWLELKPLFDFYKVNYPMQIMRNSGVIVNASVQKKLEKLNLKVADFFGEIESIVTQYIKNSLSADADFTVEKKQVEELFDALALKAEAVDVTLKNSVLGEKQKAIASIDAIQSKIIKAEKRKQETAITQLRSIHQSLFPDGGLQERKENFIPYYDADFIGNVVEQLDVFSKGVNVFSV